MTCIVAHEYNGDVLIAADTAVGYFGDKMRIVGRKFGTWETPAGTLAVGFSGSGRLAQSVIAGWNPPPATCEPEFYAFRVGQAIADYLVEQPYADTFASPNDSVAVDATMLVAWQGKLYLLGGALCAMHWERPFLSIGSGSEYSMGALAMGVRRHGGPNSRKEVEQRVGDALSIAAAFQEDVRPPYHFEWVERASAPTGHTDRPAEGTEIQ